MKSPQGVIASHRAGWKTPDTSTGSRCISLNSLSRRRWVSYGGCDPRSESVLRRGRCLTTRWSCDAARPSPLVTRSCVRSRSNIESYPRRPVYTAWYRPKFFPSFMSSWPGTRSHSHYPRPPGLLWPLCIWDESRSSRLGFRWASRLSTNGLYRLWPSRATLSSHSLVRSSAWRSRPPCPNSMSSGRSSCRRCPTLSSSLF